MTKSKHKDAAVRDAVQVIRRYQEFMRLKATASQLAVYLYRNGLTPGVDWRGSTKSDMAEEYATQSKIYGRGITADTLKELHEKFGSREER